MRNVLIYLIIIGYPMQGHSQIAVDAESIFKMHLFLDKPLVKLKKQSNAVKNDSLYTVFSDLIKLELDTLKVYDNSVGVSLLSNYTFYQLVIYDDAGFTDNIKYSRALIGDEEYFYSFIIGEISSYVIAINNKSGESYRLYGFKKNDFLFFMSDFKETYEYQHNHKLSAKELIKRYKVENLDFSCLYEGLYAKKIDREKYPCLKRVNDPIISK